MVSIESFVNIKKSEGYKEVMPFVSGYTSLQLKVKDWVYSFHVNHDSKDVEYRVVTPYETKGFIIYNLNHVLVRDGKFFRVGE
ncbi:hypothetical protein F485_gp393 [Aeromonas phage CC2]|uniref:Uncharacterized protein n=1 Tax=Aeromonas phage CC2 TaxID=1204516 RepID=I6WMK1_9CAUD|nr:hypothetical protein F485_gp393 [Aeromonas phage CC2]AFN39448.1 hypothetical protein CC2_393 [Aeromonas phage CC2]